MEYGIDVKKCIEHINDREIINNLWLSTRMSVHRTSALTIMYVVYNVYIFENNVSFRVI